MSLLSRIFGTAPAPGTDLGPLWRRIVAIGREPEWYATGGVADSLEGRFDMISAVLALTLTRMAGSPALIGQTALLTERFVDDMDGQLRQNGVGDLVVGKHMGKLMAALGGRIAAYRDGLADAGDATLIDAVNRNITFAQGGRPDAVAAGLRRLCATLADTADAALLKGEIAR